MAAPTLQAEAAALTIITANTAVAPTIPTHAADDILLATVCVWYPAAAGPLYDIPAPANWTKLGSVNLNGATKDGQIAWFWCRATAAGTTVSFARGTVAPGTTTWPSGTAGQYSARVDVIRGCIATGNPYDDFQMSAQYTTANQNTPAVTVSGAERTVMFFGAATSDATAAQFTARTNFTMGTHRGSVTGTGGGMQNARRVNVSSSESATATTHIVTTGGRYYALGGISFKPVPPPVAPTAPYTRLATSTGTIRYVATAAGGGSDSNNGAIGTPWLTLQKALTDMANGDICYVRQGTYAPEYLFDREGTVGAPKTIMSYPTEQATISGAGRQTFGNLRYVRFQDLIFTGCTNDVGCWVTGASDHLEFYNCTSHTQWQSCWLTDAGAVGVATTDIHFINCKAYNAGVRDEATHNLDHGWYLGGDRQMVINCLAYDNDAFGLQLYSGGDGSIVAHSVFDGNGKSGIIIAGVDGTEKTNAAIVYDNIISNNSTYGISHSWGGTVGEGNLVKNNITFNNTSGDYLTAVSGYTLETSVEDTDPVYVDRTAKNFAIQTSSPAKNTATGVYDLPFDHLNVTRDGTPDIGAYEYILLSIIPTLVMPPMVASY